MSLLVMMMRFVGTGSDTTGCDWGILRVGGCGEIGMLVDRSVDLDPDCVHKG
jgi:hypothetical protein